MRNPILFFGFVLSLALIAVVQRPTPQNRMEPRESVSGSVRAVSSVEQASREADSSVPSIQADWETRLREVSMEPDWFQSELLEDTAASLAEDQIPDVLDHLMQERTGTGLIFAELLLDRWAESSPTNVGRWITCLPEDSFSTRVYGKVAAQWAERDLTAAMDWVSRLPAGENKAHATISLATEAATQKQSVTAIGLIAGFAPSGARDDTLNYAAQQWAETDHDSAVAWISRIPDSDLREGMLEKVAANLGVWNPRAAVELASTVFDDDAVRDGVLVNIVRFWTPAEPDVTSAWVEQFPEGYLQSSILENLIDVWSKQEPAAACAWLNSLSPGAFRNAALKAYAAVVSESAPEDNSIDRQVP
jgi:hypothetical protein